MAHESFINYARHRYLKFAVILVVVSVFAFVFHDPHPRANGGTWLGYTLGGLCALIILILLYLGIRKRDYHSAWGSLKGWVSAHVWLGLSLLVLTTLHSGAQIGWNIHTLAYVLLILTVLSGIWGMLIYQRNPSLMTNNRDQQTRLVLLEQLFQLDAEALQQAGDITPELHHRISQATQKGKASGVLNRIFNRHWSDTIHADRHADHYKNIYHIEKVIADQMAACSDADTVKRFRELLGTVSKRRMLSQKLGRDLQLQAQMELWLFMHVPLSIALLAALISHIVSVFFYW